MGALVQINGVTQRRAVVPFGSTVTLTNAAPAGSSQKWEVIDYPTDLDDTAPDFVTNFGAWVAAADGSYFVNQSSGPFGSVTFKPDVTGPYLVKLTSNEGATVVQTAVIRVVEVHSGEHLPAAGETTEEDLRQGHKKVFNLREKRMAKRMQGYIRVANVSGSPIPRGKVVRLTATVDAHTITPASNPGGTTAAKGEKVYTITVADNTAAGAQTGDYAILDETLANNQVGWAQKFGLFEGKGDVNYTGFTVNNRIYFDSAGNQVNAPPGTGASIPVGTLLENGSTGSLSIALAGVSVNELVTGRAGGNGIVFGTQAGDGGTVTSTSNATKGPITFGAPTAMMVINESLTVDSAVGVLDRINLPAVTVTLTGNTAINSAVGFNYVNISPPTVTAANPIVLTHSATVYVGGPPVLAGTGPASATNLSAVRIGGTWTNTGGTGRGLRHTTTFAPTSGIGSFVGEEIAYTVNQTGGANGTVTGLIVNATETAVVGAHRLADLQVGGISKLLVTNAGVLAGGATASGNLTLTSTINATKGQIIFDSTTGMVWDSTNLVLKIGNVAVDTAYNLDICDSTRGSFKWGNATIKGALSWSGSGSVSLGAVSAHATAFFAGGSERGRILSTGEWVVTTSLNGSTSASGNLTLASTTNATKGLIQFDSSTGLVWDGTNKCLGVGKTPGSANPIDVTASGNPIYRFVGTTSGGLTTVQCGSNSTSTLLKAYGSTTGGTTVMGLTDTGAGGLSISATGIAFVYSSSASDLVLGTNNLERARLDSAGNIFLGKAALVTTATDGFPFISTCAGPPTGVPTGKTGMVPLIYDSTNHKLYIYDGGWKGGTAPGAWS